MKEKYYLIFGIVVALITGTILISNYSNRKVKPTIPPNFREYKMDDREIYEYLTFKGGRKFYCKNSGEEAEVIEYISRPSSPNTEGAWHFRYAVVCKNDYWIFDDQASAFRIYGPFEK